MNRHLAVSGVQRQLVWIWGVGFVSCFSVMLLLTVTGSLDSGLQEAWAWFLPTILPTLGVALSAAVAQAQHQKSRTVPSFVASLSKVTSVFYLTVVLLNLLIWPLTGKGPLQWFKISGLWLGPIQGIAGVVLAVFLTGQKEN